MRINSHKARRLNEVNSLLKFRKNICNILLALHALTGYDYTATFLKKRKIKPLEFIGKDVKIKNNW